MLPLSFWLLKQLLQFEGKVLGGGLGRAQVMRKRDTVVAVLQQGMPRQYDDYQASIAFIKVQGSSSRSIALH